LPRIPQLGYREIRHSTSIKPVQRQSLQPSDPWQLVQAQAEAAKQFEIAMKVARSRSETSFFERKLNACRQSAAEINDRR